MIMDVFRDQNVGAGRCEPFQDESPVLSQDAGLSLLSMMMPAPSPGRDGHQDLFGPGDRVMRGACHRVYLVVFFLDQCVSDL
jgi:hypothetical protein